MTRGKGELREVSVPSGEGLDMPGLVVAYVVVVLAAALAMEAALLLERLTKEASIEVKPITGHTSHEIKKSRGCNVFVYGNNGLLSAVTC